MNRLITLISSINELIGKIVSSLNIVMVMLVCVDVLVRYLFKQSTAAFNELEWHLFAFIFLLGAGWTLLHEKHVRVDIFYSKLNPSFKSITDIFGIVFFLFPFCLVLIYTATPYAITAFETNEGSPDTGGLPYRWVVKSAIAVGAFLLFLQGIALLLEKVLFLIQEKEMPDNVT